MATGLTRGAGKAWVDRLSAYFSGIEADEKNPRTRAIEAIDEYNGWKYDRVFHSGDGLKPRYRFNMAEFRQDEECRKRRKRRIWKEAASNA